MQCIKIGIIDDNKFCRDLTKLQLLAFSSVKFDIVLEANGIASAQAASSDYSVPQVILLDVMMPEIDGITGISILKKLYPEVHIIMLSDIEDPLLVRRSLLAGAHAFVKKGTNPIVMIHTVIDVLTGNSYAEPELTKSLFLGVQKSPRERQKLSAKELSIVHRLLEGLSLEMIARSFKITIDYLWEMIKGIIKKLNISYQI